MSNKRKITWFIIILLINISVYLYVRNALIKAEPYRMSESYLSGNGDVIKHLGKPTDFSINILMGDYLKYHVNSEEEIAKCKINIIGTKDKGRAVIELENQKGRWAVKNATLILRNGEEINLTN